MNDAVRRSKRAGFTLIEILVSLVLLSVLVAAVFPVVTQQVGAADPARVASDLSSIRTGVETFSLNVKGRFPGDLEDLATRIEATDKGIGATAAAYSATKEVARWKGPYFDASIKDGGQVITGFDAKIQDDLVLFDATNNVVEGATGYNATTGTIYVAVEVSDLGDNFSKVNELVDGLDETDAASSGRLRQATDTDKTVYYLATPFVK